MILEVFSHDKMAEVGKLENEALKRKERLKALKQKRGADGAGPPGKRLAEGETLPKPVFRSYKPKDESLAENQLPKAKPLEVESKVQDQLEASKPQPLVDEIDLINLAPRKPDWDLKRDIAKKLEKLERRTQRAIAELIRERLSEGQGDLASAVSANPQDVEDDED